MKIQKAKNKYFIRKMLQGKTYYLFFDSKPTKKDIKAKLLEKVKSVKLDTCSSQRTKGTGTQADYWNYCNPSNNITLDKAISEYININEPVLSASTIKGYIYIKNIIPNELLKMSIYKIDNDILQYYINSLANKVSTKTIKNRAGLIIASIKNKIDGTYKLKYPKHIINNIYMPNDIDIKKINDKLLNTRYYTFFRLALYGLRVSEILALDIKDITTSGYININKAKILNKNNQYIIKTTKTEKSTRTIKIDNQLTSQILKQGYITNITYKQFYNNFSKILASLNIPYFNPHKLRHYLASKMHLLNIPNQYICEYGGWATDNVLKNHYIHTIKSNENIFNNMLIENITNILK